MKVKKPSRKQKKNNKDWRQFIWYFLIVLMGVSIVTTYLHEPKAPISLDFSLFMQELDKGSITEISVRPAERLIVGKSKDGNHFKTHYLDYPNFIGDLRDKGVSIKVNPSDSGWVWGIFVQALLPFLLIVGLWFFIFRQAQGMNNQALSFGKSRASSWKKEKNDKTVRFKDIAGVDEAVEEVQEIVEFLKTPKKYIDIGAKIPKGVLLMGPPGTGKTLLARAIAGEADVPFFSLSGSDFVEMFVGVGASRVRDLFSQAQKNQPSIIFVDELDAVGRHRGAGLGGGHDEREQTLNQLLVEMDGFDPKATVIVIAATNRPDILDPALLRPGRFDRQIVVDKPDVKGRKNILAIHAKGKKIEKNVDFEIIAKRTPGFTGADLANLVNESALLAARRSKPLVSISEFEEATDRVMAGPERKSRLISTKEKEIVAYHELGHAIVALELPNADPVHKISILPRGLALGYTLQLPIEDKHLISKSEIEDQIKILMGGRIAEDLIFGSITSGASNDIEKATELATKYVCLYGMSKKLGTRKYGKTKEYVFLGKDYNESDKDYSDSTSSLIDTEIKQIIDNCYQCANDILTKNKKKLIQLSKLLIEKEVIEGSEFRELYQHS
ncbi:MAG: ATP-dependent zinc metalloprotease FtsH [bacterium]